LGRRETADRTSSVPVRNDPAVAGPDVVSGRDGGDAATPLYEITSLPEMKYRGELREKLARYYPPSARDRGIEGVVLLEVVVNSSGRIVKAEVVEADPPLFARAAVKVSRELSFIPAYLGTKPVAVRIRLPIRFQLVP